MGERIMDSSHDTVLPFQANHHHKDEVLWIKEDSYDDHANALIGKASAMVAVESA